MEVMLPDHKAVAVKSKFTSELDVRNPDDAEEMNCRVFGRDYKKDARGKPINMSRGSDAWFTSHDPKHVALHRDYFIAHINAIRTRSATGMGDPNRGPYLEDADREKDRINALRLKAGLPAL